MQTERKIRVKVFVPSSFEGTLAVATLQEVLPTVDVNINYVSHLDFREYEQFKDADVNIILGLAYMGYALPSEFYKEVDIPFTDFIHYATYGVPIEATNVNSVVNEDSDPIKELYHFLLHHANETAFLGNHFAPTEKAQHIADAANAYRTWTWEGNNVVRMLLALYHCSYKYLPHLIKGKGLKEVVRENSAVIKGQFDKLEDYIAKKSAQAKQYKIVIDEQDCLLIVIFAEEYVNELASHLLKSSNGPTVVCVGRATKGTDLFSVRTKGVNASTVAYLINEGQGKENVASFFSPVNYNEFMGDSIAKQIEVSK